MTIIYSSSFTLTENPISESNKWDGGATVGLDWHDCQTNGSEVFGGAIVAGFTDCLAALKLSSFTFSDNQYVKTTVHRAGGYSPTGAHELELLLRFNITAHSATGYEVLWGATGELNIVRWDGPLNNFTALLGATGPNIGAPADGDVLEARALGNFIFVYKNGTFQNFAYDATYLAGNPGVGFWPADAGDVLASLGWSSAEFGNLSSDLQVCYATGTTTATATVPNVTGGGSLVAFLCDGNNASGPTTHTVSDGQGSYTARGAAQLDAGDSVWVQAYELDSAVSGTHTVVGTIDTGNTCELFVIEMDGGNFSGANSNLQANPGTGADAITTGSVTVTGPARLVALATDSATSFSGQEPAAGTGFTALVNGFSSIGSWRVEVKSVSVNTAATFTAITGTDTFISAAVAILNPVVGGSLLSIPLTFIIV